MFGEYIKRLFRYVIRGCPQIIIHPEIVTIDSREAMAEKVILITGGNRGLGKAIAKKCISEGAKVIIVGRNIETMKAFCEETSKNIDWIRYDVSDCTNYKNLIEEAEKKFNRPINVLIHSAGISLHEGNFRNVTLEDWDSQFTINLKSIYFLTQTFIKYCTRRGITNASVIMLSSERGLYGDDIPYGLTKAALNNFVKGISRRVITTGIRVNGIAPGVTATDMTGVKEDDNLYREASCGKRVFLAEEVAEVAAFLIQDNSKCISGEIIACNQGNHFRSDW